MTGSTFWLYTGCITATYAIAIIGLNVIAGLAGQVNLATTAFLAFGGYGYAIYTVTLHIEPWLGLVLAMVGAVIISAVLGLILLRLRGYYLAMATFTLAIAVASSANAASITGGAVGIPDIPPLTVGPIDFGLGSQLSFYGLAWGIVIVLVLLVWLANASPIGRAWRLIGSREELAMSLGVSTLKYKVAAFVVAGGLGALSGAMYAELTTYVSSDLYSSSVIVVFMAMLFVGGLGTMWGPVIGALIVTVLPSLIGGLQGATLLVVDSLFLAVIVLFPSGLGMAWRDARTFRYLVPRRLWSREK
jgi:branched-chain amino acid transport system permease protein